MYYDKMLLNLEKSDPSMGCGILRLNLLQLSISSCVTFLLFYSKFNKSLKIFKTFIYSIPCTFCRFCKYHVRLES